jgi:N-methylhydantoinase A/oxoprolinase/acetone carboxylase beta subunit
MKFDFFKKKREPENLKEILAQFKELKKNFEKISKEIEKLKKENQFSLQKIGILRFNPFKEVGGNQSFSLAILDGNDDGVVITSLFTREGNRVYGKPIKKGQSEHLLTEEEKKAIEIAKYGNKNRKLNHQATGSSNFGSH